MSRTISESTLSPPPFSPFSTYSTTSGATSDDAPDLGAFTTVFRALNTFHNPRIISGNPSQLDSDESARTPTSTFLLSDYDSEAPGNTTVWAQRTIADYLDESDDHPDTTDFPEDEDQPSLGLAGALDFLAAERAKFVAQRPPAGSIAREHSSNATSDDTWRHAVGQQRRRRRRKRNGSRSIQVRRSAAGNGSAEAIGELETTNDEDEDEDDTTDSSDVREPMHYYESTPASPPLNTTRAGRAQRQEREDRLTMHHSQSTPSLRLTASIPIDPRVLQLRNLAHKLRMLFPKDAASLAAVLSDDQPGEDDFVDPRGPVPRAKDTLVHVFIDHSNILIGFLMYLKRHMHRMSRKTKQLSHAALALILERGRPVTRRVLATSSPLYQPVDSAEQLGYEVHILQRVPDAGDGADRQYSSSSPDRIQTQNKRRSGGPSFVRGHSRGGSLTTVNTTGPSSIRRNGTSPVSDSNTPSNANSRTRMREQGVDELLQLKLHQALASTDEVPTNATIVLATGDGNVGQFNEDGFLGCVKLALKKGWRVELYAWEGGLSKMWKREFGTNKRFEIHMLDRFAVDLLEL
ncbi:hypothetical protein BDY19DRAFT_1092299 [Irpex rosettiformis]|uniref:Uncharacterized protein n=1 Tax=Irpex rosettiformis TaxID=378272 RepID=A0ACB8TYS9_9APHY|nr:hypothetical protein BDY19DRAFT_1092299 [Irpex rosettiformis]